MIWFSRYLIAGLVVCFWMLWEIFSMKRHAKNCDAHHDSVSFLKKLDEEPLMWPFMIFLTILMWPHVVYQYLKIKLRNNNDEDEDDPQEKVPPQYR